MWVPRVFAVLALLVGLVATPLGGAQAKARRFRFETPAASSLLVHGTYPKLESSCVRSTQPLLHARFRGAIEVGKDLEGGLFVIGELPFEDYLKGIAEVPRSWPLDALKAQVVAARTYALNRLERGSDEGRALGYDLCATTACQVYVGMGVEAGPRGERWVRAVEETAGEVLLYEGEPASTYYSSTSNGRTYPVEQVFGGESVPYLRGVVEQDDRESPLAEWEVRMPLDDLARFLASEGAWSGGRITEVVDRGKRIVVRGGGERARFAREDLRDALNSTASCLDPDYPSTEPDGYRLPQTIPSDWYDLRQEGAAAVFRGRGWGHGVGMVQWGAKGKADRGLAYGDILAAYYGGLRPEGTEVPGMIKVLVADGLESVTIEGEATVSGTKGEPPEAPWLVTRGRRVRIAHGEPPAAVLTVAARPVKPTADGVRTRVEASTDVNARFDLVRDGTVVASTPWEPLEDGGARLTARFPDAPSGSYDVQITATDGVDTVTTQAGTAQVPGVLPSPSPSPTRAPTAVERPTARRSDPLAWVFRGAALLLALVALVGYVRGRRKGGHRA